MEELCVQCKHDYENWLEDNAAEAREEGLRLPAAELLAALEMFDAEMTEAIGSVRKAVAA